MGTNFYAIRFNKENKCRHCLGTGFETIHTHIGKASGGWTFGFHAATTYDLDPENGGTSLMKPIESYPEWISYLEQPGIKIINEYGDEVTLDEFKALVESKKNEKMNHTAYVKGDHRYTLHAEDTFYDADGNSFTRNEFS